MNWFPKVDIAEATRLTRAGRLREATDMLMGRHATETPMRTDAPNSAPFTTSGRTIDLEQDAAGNWAAGAARSPSDQHQRPRASSLTGLLDRLELGRAAMSTVWQKPVGAASTGAEAGQRFEACSFTNAAGTRPYRLYVPSSYTGAPMPLIVMMHGCTQSPDDFAAGTRMNAQAEARGFMVAYPGQTRKANASKCWNWFNDANQHREQGEPSLIAGITRRIMAEWAVDPRRVYIAGLSAGGAQAAIMGSAYPDLFAAIGVHSGLGCGAARDMLSGLAAMRNGAALPSIGAGGFPPTIVFHGDKDATVALINGDQLVAQVQAGRALKMTVAEGQSAAGRRYTRRICSDAQGRPVLEQWVLHGAGHAWSGGDPAGSFTEPEGPDASAAMVAFFLQSR